MFKLAVLFHSSRPVSWVNTAYPFAAGYVVVTQSWGWVPLLATLYFLIPYNLLLYGVNDVYDYESDLQNPRKGGIEGAKLARPLHGFVLRAAVVSNLPFLAILFWQGSLLSNWVLAAVVVFVLAYSLPKVRFKEIPLLDSITSSLHFCGPLIYALVLAGWHVSYWPVVAAFFIWGMASHAFGAVQDVTADRQAGIGSIATVIGAALTVRVSCALYLVAAGILCLTVPYGWVAAGACAAYAANIVPYLWIRDSRAHTANRAWRRFLYLNYASGALITVLLIFITAT